VAAICGRSCGVGGRAFRTSKKSCGRDARGLSCLTLFETTPLQQLLDARGVILSDLANQLNQFET
jgi:hypothetical protein